MTTVELVNLVWEDGHNDLPSSLTVNVDDNKVKNIGLYHAAISAAMDQCGGWFIYEAEMLVEGKPVKIADDTLPSKE
jgi:hypothetical protein